MDAVLITLMAICFSILLVLIGAGRRRQGRLPPGSLGFPLIGQSLQLLRAMRANTADSWVLARVQKYGPVSKLSLFGKPAVLLCGPAANKLVFGGDSSTVANQQTQSIRMILGERSMLELNGDEHRRVRGALVSFLKPESLKQYVEKMNWEVRRHLEIHWVGKQKVQVLPLMRNLTFNIICSLLFVLERGIRSDDLLKCFQEMVPGMWSVPVKLPFTTFSRSLQASSKVKKILKEVIQEKRAELERQGTAYKPRDLISSFLTIGTEEKEALTEEEIMHNSMLLLVGGYDPSSVLITFIVRFPANDPTIHAAVLQEQEEIAKSKAPGVALTREDLAKMKYTWRVALETLRLIPPIFGGFRKAARDIEYDGYLIPKGWQIFWVSSMTHMDESIYPEPSKCDPSRYENQLSVPPYCFVGFGGGPRICPGNDFARPYRGPSCYPLPGHSVFLENVF